MSEQETPLQRFNRERSEAKAAQPPLSPEEEAARQAVMAERANELRRIRRDEEKKIREVHAQRQLQVLQRAGAKKPDGTAKSFPASSVATPSAPVVAAVFSHDALIQLIIDNPDWSHKQYGQHFGRSAGWFTQVLARDDFQLKLDARRGEILDPSITATMEERFRALTLQGIAVLHRVLDGAKVEDATVLKAVEIGIKGQPQKKENDTPPPAAEALDSLADRLTAMLASKGKQGMIEHRTQQQLAEAAKLSPTDAMLVELKELPDAEANQ